MTFLPIVERELRVASRRRLTFWVRWLGAIVAVVIFYELCFTPHAWSSSGQVGANLFYKLTFLAAVYSVVFGALATADSFSSEKRDGTLGLLFLTDLKGYDVVFGKMVSNSLRVAYGLLAVFPVMAICIPLGGITGGEFFRTGIVLMNALFFALAMGVFISVLFRRERGAVVGALMAVLSCTIIPALFREEAPDSFALNSLLSLVDPFWSGQLATDWYFSKNPNLFYSTLLTNHLLSWLLVIVACRFAPECWQDRALTPFMEVWKKRWKIWCHGSNEERTRYRFKLLNQHPILWLASRDRLQRTYVWLVLAIVAAIWMVASRFMPYAWHDPLFAVFASLTFHTYLKLWITSEACRRFADERSEGSFELLLSTPLKSSQIVEGQRLALQRQFLGPVVVVLFIDLLLLLFPFTYYRDFDDLLLWCFGMVASMYYFVLDAKTLACVGMLASLKTKSTRAAVIWTVSRVIGVPWLGFLFLFSLFNHPDGGPGVGFEVFWMAILKLNDFRLLKSAARELHENLRHYVTGTDNGFPEQGGIAQLNGTP